ncbi:carboxymuconolactone decarboxylase family protein [Hansschlegelia zhihuaiae]|uniref:Carboxymuconolactone decarboxylase family protein n=1 Tax=Hansschlegelia zhihuaiae TaxID=405005 RepID=A0A4Q0MNU1_9HYPH|nr:carboxymuconolactone decarboxylase family protein [Hansschlegelia zhihuaiae]RXF74779.1 carboxymuconolactone decarboxylase family protein [Hansschlegelia zhihuaiae]
MSDADDRQARGRRTLSEYHGRPGEEVIERLGRISPDFARQLVDYCFGDVYCRPGLDRRSRQVATIAALAALGNAEGQLKWHVRGGLNIGLSREEIVEILMQMAIYGGFPAAVRALIAAQEVFDEIDIGGEEAARQDDA